MQEMLSNYVLYAAGNERILRTPLPTGYSRWETIFNCKICTITSLARRQLWHYYSKAANVCSCEFQIDPLHHRESTHYSVRIYPLQPSSPGSHQGAAWCTSQSSRCSCGHLRDGWHLLWQWWLPTWCELGTQWPVNTPTHWLTQPAWFCFCSSHDIVCLFGTMAFIGQATVIVLFPCVWL